MTARNIAALILDWRRLLWVALMALYLPFLNLELGLPIAFAGLVGTAVIVGLYTADPNRFRLYGLSRRTTRQIRFVVAALIGAIITLSLVPGVLINGSRNAMFCAVGTVIGLSVQAFRRPEESFGAKQPFIFATDAVRGIRFDILIRPLMMWIAVIVGMLLIYPMIIRRGHGDVESIMPAMMGAYWPMLAGMVVLVKNQLSVSRIYGRSATCVVRDLRWVTLSIVALYALGTMAMANWAVERLEWHQLLPLLTMSLTMQVALFIGAFRKLGIATPVIVFVGVIAVMISSSVIMDSPAFCIAQLSVMLTIWLFVLFFYAPRRARTGVFGSSGLRESFGSATNVTL